MSFFYDVVDWVGGYPYEYASVEEIERILSGLGLTVVKVKRAPVPTGCNEFVFRFRDAGRGGISANRQFYEDLWRKGWRQELENPGVSHQTRRRLFLSCLRKVYRPGASVLDAGCGDGTLLRDIVREFPDVGALCGADVSETALEAAREKLPCGRFVQADLQKQPPPFEHPFDIVINCDVLEHVQDYRGVLKHIARSLRGGGALVLAVPNDMRHWGPHDEAVGHLRRFDAADLKRDLEDAGLAVERIFCWGGVLYQLYYRMVLNRVSPETAWRRKSAVSRLLHRVLYWCFHLDDLFAGTGRGRMLFAVARKPRED